MIKDGMLTIENIEEVTHQIESMLKGKRYTFVAVNSFFAHKDDTKKALFLMSTIAPTVRTSQEIKGNVNKEFIRRMTPREWARLQGFPDNFKIPVSDAQAYKQFGNSVAVPAIYATGKNILSVLKKNGV